MPVRIPVQTRLSREILDDVQARCRTSGLSLSEWLRALVIDECVSSDDVSESDRSVRLDRNAVFATVALDALLAGHPDPQLRGRVRTAYARKLELLGLASTASTGGYHEA